MKKSIVVLPNMPAPARYLCVLVQRMTRCSRQQAARWIRDGQVLVDGCVVGKSHEEIPVGAEVQVEYTPPAAPVPRGTAPTDAMRIVHEDQDLLVVYKPAHLLTVPTPYRESTTLLSLASRYVLKTEGRGQAYCVHRLDRGVSGILVMAKSLEMAEKIREQFAQRKPHRQYLALVHGQMKQSEGTIQSYLATDPQLNRYSVPDQREGELAITHYRVTELLRDASMLEVRLETGRRNQIRVHLSEQGHPVLGDSRYGRLAAAHFSWPHKRLGLHAETLSFEHPRTGQRMSFRDSWPEEFREFRRRAALPNPKSSRRSS
jgi:23S rRNA pseudouridine1911/1915/1917 synthase